MEENELIRKSLTGDEEAFTLLLQKYHPTIMGHCLSMLKDPSLAEDMTQEASLKAFQQLHTFRKEAVFGTWFWRIAHNLCLDYMRKKKEMPLQGEEIASPETLDESLIEEWVEHLPFKHKQVLELYYLKQLSQKEISQKLNIPYGTVRSRIYYAKKRLRKFLS